MAYKASRLGQTGLVLVCDQSSFVGLRIQDYRSLRLGVMICAILIKTLAS